METNDPLATELWALSERLVARGDPGGAELVRQAIEKLPPGEPELFEALSEIAEHPGPNADDAAWWRVERARAALLKARGEQSQGETA